MVREAPRMSASPAFHSVRRRMDVRGAEGSRVPQPGHCRAGPSTGVTSTNDVPLGSSRSANASAESPPAEWRSARSGPSPSWPSQPRSTAPRAPGAQSAPSVTRPCLRRGHGVRFFNIITLACRWTNVTGMFRFPDRLTSMAGSVSNSRMDRAGFCGSNRPETVKP
jgi:hypothetical protein